MPSTMYHNMKQQQPTGFAWYKVQQAAIATACLVCCMHASMHLWITDDRCFTCHLFTHFCISRPLFEANIGRAGIAQMTPIGSSACGTAATSRYLQYDSTRNGNPPQSLNFETSQEMQSFDLSQHSTRANRLLEHKAVNLVVTVA